MPLLVLSRQPNDVLVEKMPEKSRETKTLKNDQEIKHLIRRFSKQTNKKRKPETVLLNFTKKRWWVVEAWKKEERRKRRKTRAREREREREREGEHLTQTAEGGQMMPYDSAMK